MEPFVCEGGNLEKSLSEVELLALTGLTIDDPKNAAPQQGRTKL
jgi:hypothetical protein